MNRIFSALLVGFFLMLLQSCDKEDSIDSSHITDHKWVTSSITLSEPVDLNNDGVLTTNVLDELPCYKEYFYFGNNKSLYLTKRNRILTQSSEDPEQCFMIDDCEDYDTISNLANGSYEMIDETKIKLVVTPFLADYPTEEFVLELIDEKLIRHRTIFLPVDYDETHNCYRIVQLSAKYEFEIGYFYL